MTSNTTQCPHCEALFRITDQQLQAAGGQVRCGQCQKLFDGRANLQSAAASPPFPPADLDPDLDLAALESANLGRLGGGPPVDPMAETMMTGPAQGQPARKREKFVAPRFSPKFKLNPKALLWPAGSALLVAVALIQVLVGMRGALADNLSTRPMIQGVCAVVGCSIPLRRDTGQLVMVERKVSTHPRAPKALLIEGVLENQARFPQPYPVMELVLSGVNGQVVAARRFQPYEYLANPLHIEQGMGPRASAPILLDVADPGRDAVSFEFKFL